MMTFDDAYSRWRNLTRRYRAESIAKVALDVLHELAPDPVTEVRRAPWLAMLMVKWVCQDEFSHGRTELISRPKFDELHDRLWKLQDEVNLFGRDTLPVRLSVRRFIRPQVGFQRGATAGLVREAALIAREAGEHPLRQMFESKANLGLHDFIDLSIALHATFNGEEKKWSVASSWFNSFRAAYSDTTINSFLNSVGRTFPQLVKFFRELPDAQRKVASEYFEFPVLARYPLLLVPGGVRCWHATVFYRGMEGFVHTLLSQAGAEYIEPFSRLFERHVIDEARQLQRPFLDEEQLRALVGKATRVPDGLISFPGVNVFVECKTGLFDESVMSVGHREVFAHKTKGLIAGVKQAWATSMALRRIEGAPADIRAAAQDCLLIVTNKDLGASRGTALASMYPPGTLEYPSAEAERWLPLERVYVLPIEDFERLIASGVRGQIDLPALLARCVEDDRSPATSVMFFEQHLNKQKVPGGHSRVVAAALEASAERLARALQGKK